MNSIHRLRESLYRALASPESHNDEPELFDELMVQRPRLLKLLDVGPQNAQEQRELGSGKTTINGKSAAVNADFARQAIFLSQQLGCSEKYVAGVLHHVMSENPNIGPVQCMELTVATFHQQRRHLVDCLRFLLEAAEASELPDASIVYRRLGTFVKAELLPGPRPGGSEPTLARKVFKEIEQLDVLIGKVDAARKNAGSNTVVPSGQGSPAALGFDVLNARHDSLRYERRYLAVVLCAIARLKCFLPNEIQLLVEWLSSNPSHPLTHYILTAVLVIFDPIDPSSPIPLVRQTLATDVSLMTFMTKKLEPSTKWKDPGLKATVLLKWTMFLTESRHNDTTLEHRTGFKTEELETQVWSAVQGDTFTYLALAIQHLEGRHGSSSAASLLDNLHSDQQDQREVPPGDFKLVFLLALETLVRSLITHASSELRKVKQRQEDLVLATARTDRNRTASRFASTLPPESEKPEPEPRQDIAMLYTFIGLLFSALPEERALQFWGSGPQQGAYRPTYQESMESISGRLPAFLQWAVWSTPTQDLTMLAALYDMLSGLANGQQCSELAYNFMARGGGEVLVGSMVSSTSGPSVSWVAIFALLDSWAVSAANPRSQPQTQSLGLSAPFSSSFQNLATSQVTSQQFIIGPKTVLLARSFLRVLSTVITHSVAVRTTICGHAHFRAIPTLLSLIPLGIPLELKGAIFETLAAFCEAGAGVAGVEICKAVWTLMERLEVINVRMWPSTGVSMATGKGMEVELEQIESAHKSYPATIPFLKLLSTLIHTPKQVSLQDQVAGAEPLNTIPESLGQPYRLSGIGPFTSFVVDNVFAKIPNREYARPSDRWETNDLCLRFMERSLASFNLESLITGPDDPSLNLESLTPILIHPGYDIIKRLLTDSQLRASILSYIVEGLEGFEKGLADEDPFFRNTIVRVLRVVLRVLKIQDIFLDVFIPLLSDFNSSSFVGQVHSRSYFTRIDQALSFGPQYIPAVAAYMTYPSHPELVLLSVKILAKLSLSISPSTLVTLIERSPETERILAGFKQIISTESMDDITLAEEFAEQTTGAGAPVMDSGGSGSLEQANRLAALDLLIQDTELNRPFPNIAHFLLFGGKVGNQTIQDPHALGARQTSIHILLELVNAGIPRLRGKRKERDEMGPVDPLFITLPGLAERCYRVLYQLCIHSRTSDFTTRYLRTREDFFARQIAKVPAHVPQSPHDATIQVLYGDGSRVTTNIVSLSSFLRLRSYIFDLVALELHVLTNKGHFKGVSELLDILFGTDFEYEEEHEFTAFHEVGQSPMRIIDLFQSLIFDWADSLSVEPISLQYLGSLNLQSCIRQDATGCEIVDRTTLLSLLSAAKRTVHAQGGVATSAQNDRLSGEISYILESCAIENHRRKVSHARVGGFEAWRRLLDLALMKCFDRLPHNRRENMLFDLLHVLPVAIRSANIEESTAILLSETVLSSITKLREDRQHQIILQSVGGESESGSLPAERLYSILRSILESILDSNHVELVRGNLYAALINFIHLMRSSHDNKTSQQSDANMFAVSISHSAMRDSLAFSGSESLLPSTLDERLESTVSALELGGLAVLKPVIERLVTTIARDAIDGTEVWKTIAFMLLDATVQLSSLEKQHVVLSALTRHGVLSNFVRSLKDSDSRLQSVLKPDPDDLNTLYVYEAKMSLFIRMGQSRPGAERLLEAQLLPILAQCDYVDTRPEADQSFLDQDSLLPSAIQRYHQLLMPVLQVVDVMLATLGSKHTTATHQALNFLSNHGSTIAILLKNEAESVNLLTLEEIHLIVALCTNVLPSVPKTELLSPNSGFGAIHLAILGLSARCLGQGKIFPRITPHTDADNKLCNAYAFGFGNQSKFDVKVRRKERLLRKGIVSYIGGASEFTEPEIALVLSPITIMPRHEERISHFAATVPTVGDTLVALEDLCSDIAETLKQISNIGAELANKDSIGINNNAQEILHEIDPMLLQNLEIDQKRSLLCQELERIRTTAKHDAKFLLDTLEMLLLLIWRHVEYYAEPQHMNMPPSKTTVANAMRLLATSEPEAFQADVRQKIAPSLQRLQFLDLDDESFGRDWQDNQGYIEIMCRRLKDSTGLNDDSTVEDST